MRSGYMRAADRFFPYPVVFYRVRICSKPSPSVPCRRCFYGALGRRRDIWSTNRRKTRQRPETKVLYSSGYDQNVIARHGVLDEGVQFLPKPYSLESLATRVREVLDSE